MNRFLARIRAKVWAGAALGALVVLSACSSGPKVDWNSRLGVYTYDQAVTDLGPPDKSSQLSDGSMVADWYQGRSPSLSFGFGVGSYGHHSGVGVGQGVTTGGDGRFLRLTFSAEGRLSRWAKIER